VKAMKSMHKYLVNQWTVLLYSAAILMAMYAVASLSRGRVYEMIYLRGVIPHLILIASSFALGLLFYKLVQTRLSAGNLSRLMSFVQDSSRDILTFVQSDDSGSGEILADRLFEPLPAGRERDRIITLLRDCREAGQDFALKRLEMFLDLEQQSSEDSFRVPQVLAWTVPMLGFLGTVWGIALSLGNFTAVMGDVDNIQQIKAGLGTITAGLGIAFDTTLLGLLFAIIITGCTTLLQRRENACLDQLERTALDVLKTLSTYESVGFAQAGVGEKTLNRVSSELKEAFGGLREQVKSLEDIAEKQGENLAEERKGLEAAADALGNLRQFSESLDNFSEASRELRRAVAILENPREYRLVERQAAKQTDGSDE